MKFCQHITMMTLILIALQYVKFVYGGEDRKGENKSILNQPEDGKLDERIMTVIEQYASRALEQKLPAFFPTTKETASHRAAQLLSISSSVDPKIVQAVQESVAFHLDKMLATLNIERPTSAVGKHSYAMATKSRTNPSPPGSSSALPARQTFPKSSEEKRDNTNTASSAASQKGKSIVQHGRPPAQSTRQRPSGSVHRDWSAESQDERTLLIVPTVIGKLDALQLLEEAKFDLESYGVIRKVPFPGGPLLCECSSADAKRKLLDAVSQNVPIDVDEHEILECVTKQFQVEPEHVSFIPYRGDRKYRKHAVLIHGDDELMKAMKERAYIIIRGVKYDIDTYVGGINTMFEMQTPRAQCR